MTSNDHDRSDAETSRWHLSDTRPRLRAAEQRLDRRPRAAIELYLSSPYRELLSRFGSFGFNGASEDDPFIHFVSDEPLPDYITSDEHALIQAFYGTDLEEILQMYDSRVPNSLLPIAHDGGSGLICLGVAGNDCDKIIYWDATDEPLDEETFEEDYGYPMTEEDKRSNLYLVANNIDEFLNSLVAGVRD